MIDIDNITGRRWIVGVTFVIGAVVLNVTLRLPRGSPSFIAASVALALIWTTPALLLGRRAIGSTTSWRRDVAIGALVGAALYGLFVVGALVARQISWLDSPVRRILAKADAGPILLIIGIALVNGAAEELFFRGALIDVLGDRKTASYAIAFVAYVGVTALVGNTALTVAAIVLAAVVSVERWVTDGVVASVTTHVTWSFLLIVALPRP